MWKHFSIFINPVNILAYLLCVPSVTVSSARKLWEELSMWDAYSHSTPSSHEHALGFITEQMYYCSLQKLVRISSVTVCDPRPKHQEIMATVVTGCHRHWTYIIISSTICVLNMSLGCFWPQQKTDRHMQSNTFSRVAIKATKKVRFSEVPSGF